MIILGDEIYKNKNDVLHCGGKHIFTLFGSDHSIKIFIT